MHYIAPKITQVLEKRAVIKFSNIMSRGRDNSLNQLSAGPFACMLARTFPNIILNVFHRIHNRNIRIDSCEISWSYRPSLLTAIHSLATVTSRMKIYTNLIARPGVPYNCLMAICNSCIRKPPPSLWCSATHPEPQRWLFYTVHENDLSVQSVPPKIYWQGRVWLTWEYIFKEQTRLPVCYTGIY